ncbi:MAG: thiamine pyrophosphate-dependent dehydrogenase E1 component subunit alpha [Ilumatobacter sp.]|uniref:thiamine pyrophosphate-dependent dehydrogenase E1 component subunit alpha n=2 Tax=Ilumatobacter sp. TaxID=1967498 RepID=UPI0032971E6F
MSEAVHDPGDAEPPTPVLELRIPEPARGDKPADRVRYISAAGEMAKPALDEKVERVALMRKQLVRVLDDHGRAVGDWVPDLTFQDKVEGLRNMMLTRSFDARLLRAHRQGKTSFYMQCLGEEAIACAQQHALRSGDMHFPTYRQQGLLISAGYPLVTMIDQVLSNEADPLRGRQLPIMYSSKEYGFFSISGNLATQYIQAVGWAMASALRGGSEIASAWIGEGASAESDFHAALVFASTYQAPVILNIVNNHWAISTPEDFARGASATFADRGYGFSIPSIRVDGNDYLAAYAASQWAAERARSNLGPTLIEWVTLRRGAHSTSDDPSVYRPADEAERFPLGDPVERLHQHLAALDDGTGTWDDRCRQSMQAEIDAEVEAAFAEASSHGSVKDGHTGRAETMFDDVFVEMPRHLREQRDQVAKLEGR